MSGAKTSRLGLRVAPADDAFLREAAELLGESMSEFLVNSVRERAERLVADRTCFVLADEQWSALCGALRQTGRGQAGAARPPGTFAT